MTASPPPAPGGRQLNLVGTTVPAGARPADLASRERGRFVESPLVPQVLATVPSSSILGTDQDQRAAAMQGLIDDLAVVAAVLA